MGERGPASGARRCQYTNERRAGQATEKDCAPGGVGRTKRQGVVEVVEVSAAEG